MTWKPNEILQVPPEQRTYSMKKKLFNQGFYVSGMSKLDTRQISTARADADTAKTLYRLRLNARRQELVNKRPNLPVSL